MAEGIWQYARAPLQALQGAGYKSHCRIKEDKVKSGRERLFGCSWSVLSTIGLHSRYSSLSKSMNGKQTKWRLPLGDSGVHRQMTTLGLALQLPGIRGGCSIIGLLSPSHGLLLVGVSYISKPSPSGSHTRREPSLTHVP